MDFAHLTTLGVGGPIADFIEARSHAEAVSSALDARAQGIPLLILGGGSNLLVSDDGFDGRVLAMRTHGIDSSVKDDGAVHVRVAAGENWDAFVAWTVDQGYAGIEALSGIPGSVGAAPIQNIGAYGQEVSAVIVGVDILDLVSGELRRLASGELEFGYRDSVFKQGLDALVLSVEFELVDARADRLSRPIAFAQLASALSVEMDSQVALADVRDAVLSLRRSKGMVYDTSVAPEQRDPDTQSAGSFFVNPIVTENFARSLPADAPRFPVGEEASIRVLEIGAEVPPLAGPGLVKLSAAWLIEHAGVPRGFTIAGSRAAVSSKHTLALTNRGGATAEEIAGLARYVRSMVQSQFGVLLQPEPVCIGVEL